MGSQHGAMAGTGIYFAVHPYADYCVGNSNTGAHYCNYDSNGYGAIFVCVGAISPSEYTYRHSGTPDRAGSGMTIDINGSSVNTRDADGICGGSYYKDFVDSSGALPLGNREIVYWFDKWMFRCILG